MKTIQYGIIGCGGHALQSHALPGLEIPGLKLVRVYDPNSAAMMSLCRKTGAVITLDRKSVV